jgi:hypothetical protein
MVKGNEKRLITLSPFYFYIELTGAQKSLKKQWKEKNEKKKTLAASVLQQHKKERQDQLITIMAGVLCSFYSLE